MLNISDDMKTDTYSLSLMFITKLIRYIEDKQIERYL